MRMGTGPPDENGMAAFLPQPEPQPGVDPAGPSPLSTAARRPAGGRTLIVDAGGEDVVVVLDTADADAQQIWDFIQQRRIDRKTGKR
jgi:hypothetical protein